jgi:uncharacterized coiled-coil protein SlyX
MTPRQAVLSSPYAMRAAAVDATAALPAVQITGALATGQLGDGTVTAAKLASNGCASGQVLKYSGTAWVCAADATGGAANAFVQNGNAFGATAVLGTTDARALHLQVNNTTVMRFMPYPASPNLIGGHPGNGVIGSAYGAAIAGGGLSGTNCLDPQTGTNTRSCANHADVFGVVGGGYSNAARDIFATVGGGVGNTASGMYSTVGGGSENTASDTYNTIAGGLFNTTSSMYSTVAGGSSNTASGEHATVPGGGDNLAKGNYSFAAGSRAKANEDRTFVWGGSLEVDTESQGSGSFVVYAPGGVRMYAGTVGSGGCTLLNGASGWSCSSDRSLKSGIEAVDASDVLDRVVSLPIARWSFTAALGVAHMGPMAQDFHAAFGLGDDPTRLAPMDVQGVALAAIQGLNAKLEERVARLAHTAAVKDDQIQALSQSVSERDAQIASQQRQIEAQQRAIDEQRAELARLRERVAEVESIRSDLAALRDALAAMKNGPLSVVASRE